jgi:hypothetical protein
MTPRARGKGRRLGLSGLLPGGLSPGAAVCMVMASRWLPPCSAVTSRQLMPFTLQWNPSRVHTIAVARFVHCALTADLPPGWHTQPDHLHHTEPNQDLDNPNPSQHRD